MFKFFILLYSLLLAVSISCSSAEYAEITLSPGLENKWKIISEGNLFYKVIEENLKTIDSSSKKYRILSENNGIIKISLSKHFSFETDARREASLEKVIGEEIRIPVTLFSDTEKDADRNDIINRRYRTDIPQNISLPEKGLSFEGRYPGEKEYGLVMNTVLTVYLPDKTKPEFADLFKDWFSSIESEQISFKDLTWVSAVGDIMPGRGVSSVILNSSDGLEKIFSDTLNILQSSDILIGNLEGAVTAKTGLIEKAYNFKFTHRILAELKKGGFEYLSVTNNHCFDYGQEGFEDTLSNLEKYGIKTSGAGRNIQEALVPSVFEAGGQTFRILSMADYPPEKGKFDGRKETEADAGRAGILWPGEAVLKAVRQFSDEAGVDIVSVHGGYEWANLPAEKQIKLYRKLAESGADIIIGSHPHVLQPVESYNGSFIAYSLGNFVFPGMDETEYGEESMILSLGFSEGKLIYINYIPVNIDGKYLSVDKSGKILMRFKELNRKFN